MLSDREQDDEQEDERDDEEDTAPPVDSASDLPLVSGLTQTASDAEPMFAKLYELLTQPQSTSQSLITSSLHTLHEAMEVEPNPMMKARLAMSIAMLREGPSA